MTTGIDHNHWIGKDWLGEQDRFTHGHVHYKVESKRYNGTKYRKPNPNGVIIEGSVSLFDKDGVEHTVGFKKALRNPASIDIWLKRYVERRIQSGHGIDYDIAESH